MRPGTRLLIACVAIAAAVLVPGSPALAAGCSVIGRGIISGIDAWRVRCDDVVRTWEAFVVGEPDEQRVLQRTSGTWLVDPDGSGRIALVARFRLAGGDAVGELYDDATGDRTVSYRAAGGDVVVTEAPAPPMVVRARGGWWMRGALVNYDLDITIDGLTNALMDPGTHAAVRAQSGERTDGKADLTLEIRDPNGWGRPRYDVRQAYFRAPSSSNVLRTQVAIAERREPGVVVSGALLPFVGDRRFGHVQPYGQFLPAIQIDWDAGKIAWVGEFVPSRGTGSGWFAYSVRRVDGAQAIADFENPFAFYDLAGAADGYPDLQIRNQYAPPRSTVWGVVNPVAISEIRYSWDLDHNHTWDFKVDLLGRHEIESSVALPSFAIRTVPHGELPQWVSGRRWDAATFIAAEDRTYWTSEGIYEWPTGGLVERYLTGGDVARAAEAAFTRLPDGMRGEYRVIGEERPLLYVSDVDGRLHMHHAQHGHYSLPGGRRLRYESLGGEVMDRWVLEADPVEVASLSYLADQLVLSDESGVRLKRAPLQRVPELLLPPIDSAGQALLRQRVASSRPSIAADDLRAHFDRLAATSLVDFLPGARASDFARDGDGFRFALWVPEQLARDPDAPTWISGREPGEYLVRYSAVSDYAADPMTPAQPVVRTVGLADPQPGALELVELRAIVNNIGGKTARDVPITFVARKVDAPGAAAIIAGRVTIDVPAGGTEEARLTWAFPSGGRWVVESLPQEAPPSDAARGAGNSSSAAAALAVTVAPAPLAQLPQLLRAQGRTERFAALAAAVLGGTLAAAVAVGARFYEAPRRPRRRAAVPGIPK